ncbi:MAG: glycosyltransferase family 2 protein [Anaerolineae bacterium]
MPPLTSVVIVTYEGLRYLEGCLHSVFREAGQDCEVIVVDNGSTDGSPDLIEKRFPEVTLVRNSENRGFAAACNQGAEMAAGRVLVFLNQDTRVEPGWLLVLVRRLNEGGSVGLTTSKVLLMSQPDRIHLCGQAVHYTGLVFGRGFLSPASDMATPQEVGAVAGTSFALRREVWEELGGFDETFYMYYEETDLSWRAQLAGYKCFYVPDSVVYHDYRPCRSNPSRLYYSMCNRYITLLKNWRGPTLILLVPALLLAELIEWGLALAYGWRGVQAKVRANFWVITHLREISRLHARTQAGRKVPDAAILKERTYRLEPRMVTGGAVGRAAVAVCNVLFLLNHRVARWLCQAMGL